jgi:cell division protein FtsA
MNKNKNRVAALDLGSTKTRALVAELREGIEGPAGVRFLGYGEAQSEGWRKGSVADSEAVTRKAKEAIERAEKAAGGQVESVVVGVGGPHITGASTSCGLTLSLEPRELTRDDVRRVMETARDIALAKDREILHLLPEEFALDSQQGILDPIGMQGSYLAVKAHIVSGSAAAAANVVAAVNRAGVLVETTVFEALAAGEEVLTDEERELGALVLLLGSGSTELAAYRHGSLRLAAVVPIGGDHFTNDVAVGLHATPSDAEILKITMGSVLSRESNEATQVEVPVPGSGSIFVPLRLLSEILESRAEELLGLVRDELRRASLYHRLEAGVVLCGGGARLGGLCDLTEQILGAPARLGLPPRIVDMPEEMESPEHATIVGLILYAQRLWMIRNAAQVKTPERGWKNLIAGSR